MTFWSFLNHGWNVPFLVLLGVVAVALVLQAVGGLLDGHDAEVDGHGDGLADGGLLGMLGVGRVPLMVVWATFGIFAGFTGLAVNRWLYAPDTDAYPGWGLPASLLLAGTVGLVAVRLFAGLAGRLVDTGGRGATAKRELVGLPGVVASPALDAAFGEVRLRDARGNELLVHAQLAPGEPGGALAQGRPVALVGYDAERDVFEAAPLAGADEG